MGAEVDGADDVAEGDGLGGEGFFHVDAGPDGAIGVVQDLGGDGAEDELAEGAVAVGRHDDQAGVLLLGEVHDLAGGIAFEDDAAGFQALQFAGEEGFHLLVDLRAAIGVQLGQHGAADFEGAELVVGRGEDVQQGQLGVKMGGQGAGVAGGAQGPFGEIHRQQDLG